MASVAVAWTGGKDSSLAFYEAEKLGYRVDCLVTFAWNDEPFLAHPLDFVALQAEALALPHYVMKVAEPYDRGYEQAFSRLKRKHGVEFLVTGDIAVVSGHNPKWLEERAAHSKIELIRPLWQRDRVELLNELLELRFNVVFSCVKKPWFTDDWIGSELSTSTVQRLVELGHRTGIDICGEQGEYHTLVTDAPQFKRNIRIESYTKRTQDSAMYIALERCGLADKTIT